MRVRFYFDYNLLGLEAKSLASHRASKSTKKAKLNSSLPSRGVVRAKASKRQRLPRRHKKSKNDATFGAHISSFKYFLSTRLRMKKNRHEHQMPTKAMLAETSCWAESRLTGYTYTKMRDRIAVIRDKRPA